MGYWAFAGAEMSKYYRPGTEFLGEDYLLFDDPRSGFLELRPKQEEGMIGAWKFHLSVAEGDVPRAWDIVADMILQRDANVAAKVAKPDTTAAFADPANGQSGKMITIYARDDQNPAFYKEMIHDIEDAFRKEWIASGPPVQGDRAVDGSLFAYYRSDRDGKGEYMDASALDVPEDQRYNPVGRLDPYRDFDIATYKKSSGLVPDFNGLSWFNVTNSQGQAARYLDINTLMPGQLANLRHHLDAHDIPHTVKETSLPGMNKVLSLLENDFARAGKAMDKTRENKNAGTLNPGVSHDRFDM